MTSVKKVIAVLCLSLILLVPIYGQVIARISGKSFEEKLGYIPQKEIMRVSAMDYKALIGEWLFFKVVVYYGGRTETEKNLTKKNIEYANMYKFLDTSTYVDPYNMDSYYFAQAIFTWELGRIQEVNSLLERGLRYRTWDFYLPFFIGFNNFYFLKDYKQASHYMEQAATLSRQPLLTNLAARFFYEANETEVAIGFLKVMIEKTWNLKVRESLERRLKGLEGIDFLERAMKQFQERYHRKPDNIGEMVDCRVIAGVPEDPYGGRYYIDENGRVRTTSKFVYGNRSHYSDKDRKPR